MGYHVNIHVVIGGRRLSDEDVFIIFQSEYHLL